jgi:hypothetical protein
MLRSDREFRTFHEGRSQVLPEFYHRMYERRLGPYAELMSRRDRVPNLEHAVPAMSGTLAVDSSAELPTNS